MKRSDLPLSRSSLVPIVVIEIIIGTILACLAFILFFDLSRTIMSPSLVALDHSLSHLVYSYRNPLLTQLMLFVTFLGGSTMLLCSSVLIMLVLLKKHYPREAALFLITFSMGVLLNLGIKELVARARPDIAPLIHEAFYSFPSGHSMNSFVFYALLVYFTFHFSRNTLLTVSIGILCTVLLIGIGMSRIYLGVHYPSDVIAGFLAGAGWFATIMVVEKTLQFFRKQNNTK